LELLGFIGVFPNLIVELLGKKEEHWFKKTVFPMNDVIPLPRGLDAGGCQHFMAERSFGGDAVKDMAGARGDSSNLNQVISSDTSGSFKKLKMLKVP